MIRLDACLVPFSSFVIWMLLIYPITENVCFIITNDDVDEVIRLHYEANSHFFQVFCLWRVSLKLCKDPFPLWNYLFIYLYTVGFMASYLCNWLQSVTSIIYLSWCSNYCSVWHKEALLNGFCVFLTYPHHSLNICYFLYGTKRYPWFLLVGNLFREQDPGIRCTHFY